VVRVTCGSLSSRIPFPVGRGASLLLARRLEALARELRLDILEAPEFGGLTAFLPRKSPRPFKIIVRLHTCSRLVKLSNDNPATSTKGAAAGLLIDGMEKRAIENADAVTSISKWTTEETLRVHGLRRDGIAAIPNPVRACFFESPRRGPFPIGADPVVLYVGRLEWRKGPDLLARAFAEIVKRVPWARLWFVGADTPTGPGGSSMRTYLRTLVAEDVVSRIGFMGELEPEDLPQFYAGAKVCVFPSRWEGFGIVSAEAMASGKPVIVPRHSGFSEHISHLRNGVLIKESEPRALAEAVAGVLSNPSRAADIGAAAKQYALQHFKDSVVADANLRVYESVWGGKLPVRCVGPEPAMTES